MSRRSKRDLFLETMEACREFISAADAVNQIIAERMGVNRTDHRRRVLIERTPESTRTAMRYYQPFMVATFDSMTKYSAEQLETVRDFMRGAAELSEEYAERLAVPDGAPPDADAS